MGALDNVVVKGSTAYQGKIADTSVTLAEVLRDAGYFTAMTGKWHVGHDKGVTPPARGFDRSLNLALGGTYFRGQGGTKAGATLFLDGVEKQPTDPIFGEDWYGTHLWTEWGLKFVDDAIAAKKPFFWYEAHVAPHFPLMAPEATVAKYRGKYKIGWDELRQKRHQKQIEMGLVDPKWPLTPLPPNTPAWKDVPEAQRDRFDHIMAIYAAVIEEMDRSVGALVEGLRQRGVLDNTLILFLSDNGGNAESGPNGKYVGDHPGDRNSDVFLGQNWATAANVPFRRFKSSNHEGGISTPLIAHWPKGIAADRNGKLESQPGHLIDIMPTLLAVSGAKYPKEFRGHAIQPMEGVSLLPALAGQKIDRSQPIFFEHEGNRAVREGNWKLVAANKQPWELYDIAADRTELNNLAAKQPEVVQRLSAAYDAWAKRTDVRPWPVNQGKKAQPGK